MIEPSAATSLFLPYLMIVNVLSFVVYGIDKLKAKRGKWRISETSLLLLALMGGSVGAWAGIRVWYHKTLHKKFKYGIPFIFFAQVVMVLYMLNVI